MNPNIGTNKKTLGDFTPSQNFDKSPKNKIHNSEQQFLLLLLPNL